MVSRDQVRKIALALTDAEEKDHHGSPSFRVKDKIFATLSLDKKEAVIKLTPAEQRELLEAWDGDMLAPVPDRWGQFGWTIVQLDQVAEDLFREILAMAWNNVFNTKAKKVIGKSRKKKSKSK